MNYKLKSAIIFFKTALILLLFLTDGNTEPRQPNVSDQRTKENFDFNWQFHKGDMAMKLVVRVGQGGITDINVPIINKKDTVIDYTNSESSASFFPPDWKKRRTAFRICIINYKF